MDEDFSTNVEEPKKEKSKAGLVILLILLSAALFAGGLSIGHFVWKGGVQSAVSSATTTLTQSTSSKVELTDAGKTEMRQKTEALVESLGDNYLVTSAFATSRLSDEVKIHATIRYLVKIGKLKIDAKNTGPDEKLAVEIDVDELKNAIKDMFDEDITLTNFGVCPYDYKLDSKNNKYDVCVGSGCGGVATVYSSILYQDYGSDDEYAYLNARIAYGADLENYAGIYSDYVYAPDSEQIAGANTNFELTESNKDKCAKYRFAFKKTDTGYALKGLLPDISE